MKILYDHQIFSYQDFGGASRYFYEVISRMPEDNWTSSVKYSNNYMFKELAEKKGLSYKQFFPSFHFYKKPRIMLELGKIHSSNVIKKGDFDVLHLTHYESYATNLTDKPIVLSYLDKLFSSYEYNERTVNEQKKCLKKTSAVITISNNTKKEFLSLFDYPEEKVHVVHLGTNKLPKVTQRTMDNNRYILFVGSRNSYKNFKNLVYAYKELLQNDPDLYLYCTGKNFTAEEIEFLTELGVYEKVKVKYVNDYELSELYTFADCFVFPSLYEGFGLPLLEAMNLGCPVCCSNGHCFPEVAENSAEYFNPEDVNSIKKAIENVIYNPSRKSDLINSGFEQIKKFTWEKTVQEHIKIYESLL